MLYENKLDIKFLFVEDFPSDEEIDYAAQLREEPKEPEKTKTKFFGEVELHQIARVEWKEVTMTVEKEKTDKRGKTTVSKERVTMYQMVPGEVGGWLESMGNLSQKGDCWVHPTGYVMGAAYVYGDAEVKGQAEVGDGARVGDKVVLDGPIGIGGNARLFDSVKVNGKRRMAVFGSAVVRGESEITEEAKAYGHAMIGDAEHKAILSGKVRAYGNCVIKGTVSDECEVFGRAVIRGRVSEKCWIGGTAFIGNYGTVSGDLIITRGSVNGTLSGEGIVNWTEFILFNASTLKLKADEDNKEPKKEYEEATDKMEDRKINPNTSEITRVQILPKCFVSDCEFKGWVLVKGGSIKDCKIEDSCLGTDDDINNWSYIIYQGRIFADSCEFKECNIPRGQYYDCKFEKVWSPIDTSVTLTACKIKNSAILPMSRNFQGCEIEDSATMVHYMAEEKIKDLAVIESHGIDIWYASYHPDTPNRKFIKPDEFKDLLGEGNNLKHLGVKEMDGIGAFVYKYDKYNKYLLERAETEDVDMVAEELEKLRKERDKILEERMNWFRGVLNELKEKEQAAIEEVDKAKEKENKAKSKVNSAGTNKERLAEALAELEKATETRELAEKKRDNMKNIVKYITVFQGMDWYVMSEDSYQSIREVILKTVDSLEDYSFIPYSDFGEITVDSSYAELQDKYKIALAIDSSVAWSYW